MQTPPSPTISTTSSLKEDELASFIPVTVDSKDGLDSENTNTHSNPSDSELPNLDAATMYSNGASKSSSQQLTPKMNDLLSNNTNLGDGFIHTLEQESSSFDGFKTDNNPLPSPIDTTPNQSSLQRTPLFREQLKYCMQIMKTLKRHRDAFPFNQPVDPVALQIPDYLDVVKQPMDLGTIANKLAAGSYSILDEWIADIQLVFSNCYAYNRLDNPVYSMGKNLEKSFETMMKKMPTGAGGPPPPDHQHQTPPSLSSSISQSPGARRSSVTSTGSITDVSRRRTATSVSQSATVNDTEDLKFGLSLIRDFWSKKISPVSWPFLQPVDPVALGIPDYLKVIKSPMDLGTVKRKLESKSYTTGSELETEVRLVFSNCYLYNAPDSEVVKLCRTVEKIFTDKWANRPSLHISTASALSSIDANNNFYDSFEEGDYDEETSSLIEAKTAQIQQLQEEIKELMAHSRVKTKRPNVGGGKKRSTSGSSASGISPASSSNVSKKQKPSHPSSTTLKPLTFEEKRQLSLDINDLPPESLGKVLEIINESMPNIRNEAENGEIELDVDTLSLATLHSLIKYVRQCKLAAKNIPASQSSKGYNHHSGRYSEDDEDDDHGSDSD